jgi:hypothetical protein
MKPSLLTNASTWTERYEAVRGHLVSGRHLLGVDPLGLVLVLKHGVAGWMRRWLESPSDPRPAGETPAVPLCPSTPVWQQQLTMLLAQMTVTQLCPTAAL